ncbi:hypothetical protein ACFOLA_11215 [Salinicoccus hispanicus]|uniref:Type II toxin-antitoxin system HicA family toxin n=1 Tax=Salinicoccus hispanicus TaxID=157225 RepID=A0A6N8U0V4_9STAP|nr:hypothetical protein [Salinicoccus hispanicus]MXQ50957.1 hypothetical protein [Salinicoccus hispanicus]
MSRKEKLYQKINNNPRNVSERDFKSALATFGFTLDAKRGKGGHQVYWHDVLSPNIIPQRTVNFTRPMRYHIIKKLINDIEEVMNYEDNR